MVDATQVMLCWGMFLLALAQMVDATHVMGFCGGMFIFLALAHLVDATQMMGCCVGRGDVYVPRTCTHGRCYTSDGVCRDVFPCLALAHMVDAAEVMGCCGGGCLLSLHLHTCR